VVRVVRSKGLGRLVLRVPEWAEGFSATCAGSEGRLADGLCVFEREWADGDTVHVSCPVAPRWVRANSAVLSCAGRATLQCGPLVYAVVGRECPLAPQHFTADLSQPVLRSGGKRKLVVEGRFDGLADGSLYRYSADTSTEDTSIAFVPYFSWADLGRDTMQVWVRRS
jgi:DUF1680 family protein